MLPRYPGFWQPVLGTQISWEKLLRSILLHRQTFQMTTFGLNWEGCISYLKWDSGNWQSRVKDFTVCGWQDFPIAWAFNLGKRDLPAYSSVATLRPLGTDAHPLTQELGNAVWESEGRGKIWLFSEATHRALPSYPPFWRELWRWANPWWALVNPSSLSERLLLPTQPLLCSVMTLDTSNRTWNGGPYLRDIRA